MAEWKDIEGYSYRISDDGRVFSLLRNREIKGLPNRKGYLQVHLRSKGKVRPCYIHRLVAAAFIGPRAINQQVNHKNGNKVDNRAVNLEYCTNQENCDHASAMGLIPHAQQHCQAKFTNKVAKEIISQFARGESSIPKLAKEHNVAVSTIRRMVRGLTWKSLSTPESQET